MAAFPALNLHYLLHTTPKPSNVKTPRRLSIRCSDDNPYGKWRGIIPGDGMAYNSECGVLFPENAYRISNTFVPPPRPRRIILVRHGQSEGNVDESAYTRIPDSKIALTEQGWHEAVETGNRIRELVERDGADDWQVYFYASPYKRTLQSLRGIGMAFERQRIAGVREEPRLREQDFGFRETLRADIDIGRFQPPGARSKFMNLVLVSHGLTLRVFLMRWYKWTVEQFERLHNFGNAGMLVMQTGSGGRYSLLVHHSPEELKAFGMTDEMLVDQSWQKTARPGELNYDWMTSGPSFFTHFDENCCGGDSCRVPPDISQVHTDHSSSNPEQQQFGPNKHMFNNSEKLT
ncbi:phosphoglycerate mutase-like protein AT74H isoform X2 [Cryptomeria japonica]|uniref:phosphoglycerate mutase-like protein AT74H isoform X2 n=1 Tax=Cryptomeria japonica TaxID=3369 RepID=UPI0027D9D6B1|nr:phosphoglycerate mutase-like protein AT74H isoform X2 [Cryptomeria japonica]